MATLNQFPARAQFVDQNGLLTPEAARALNLAFKTINGASSGISSDAFGDVFAPGTSDHESFNTESILQPANEISFFAPVVIQPTSEEYLGEMVFAGETNAAPVQQVTAGASPFAYTASQNGTLSIQGGTVSSVAFDRSSVSFTVGFTSGLIPMATGDKVTITYTVAPTLYFIPR